MILLIIQPSKYLKNQILTQKSFYPITVDSDGNCFFRSISKVLYGSEENHHEIRYRTAIELIINYQKYLQCEYIPDEHFRWVCLLAPSSRLSNLNEEIYKKEVLSICKTGIWTSLLPFYGASNALHKDIQPVYAELS